MLRARFRHPTATSIGFLQIGAAIFAVGAPFTGAGWGWWIAALFVMFLYGCVGLSVGYHRYFSHRSFEVSRPVEIGFIVLGVLGCLGSPVGWMVMHRRHHAHSDEAGDPHAPHILGARTMYCGAYADGISPHALNSELKKDSVMRWVHLRYLPLALAWPLALLAITPMAFLFLWAVPMSLTFIAAPLTNYACHKWGAQPHRTGDNSRNNWLIALLYWGEGWHNNHHARPRRAMFGERWWQVDIGGAVCRALAMTAPRHV